MISQALLRERHRNPAPSGQAHGFQAITQFKKEVGKPLWRGKAAQAQQVIQQQAFVLQLRKTERILQSAAPTGGLDRGQVGGFDRSERRH